MIKKIAKIKDRKSRAKIPAKSLVSLRKRYKELLAGDSKQISVEGVPFTCSLFWEGWYNTYHGFSDPYAEWELAKIKDNKRFNKLVDLMTYYWSEQLDDEISEIIYNHNFFSNYNRKILKFIDDVTSFEAKYDFDVEEIV